MPYKEYIRPEDWMRRWRHGGLYGVVMRLNYGKPLSINGVKYIRAYFPQALKYVVPNTPKARRMLDYSLAKFASGELKAPPQPSRVNYKR